MEWPAVLGIYGAIVATLTAVWSISSVYRDRGCLKLELRLKRFAQDASGALIEMPVDSLEGCELHLPVVNVGRRPIAVIAWYGVPRSRSIGNILLRKVIRPQSLNETEQFSMVSRDFVEAFAAGLRRMYVVDSSGRRWYVPRNRLRAIAKSIKTLCLTDGRHAEGQT